MMARLQKRLLLICADKAFGVDVDFTRNAGVRIAANERLIRASGQTSKEFQLEVGLVYRFGK